MLILATAVFMTLIKVYGINRRNFVWFAVKIFREIVTMQYTLLISEYSFGVVVKNFIQYNLYLFYNLERKHNIPEKC